MITRNILSPLFSILITVSTTSWAQNNDKPGIIFFDKSSFLVNRSGLLRQLWTGNSYHLNSGQAAIIEILKRNEYQIGTFNPAWGKPTPFDIDVYLSKINKE